MNGFHPAVMPAVTIIVILACVMNMRQERIELETLLLTTQRKLREAQAQLREATAVKSGEQQQLEQESLRPLVAMLGKRFDAQAQKVNESRICQRVKADRISEEEFFAEFLGSNRPTVFKAGIKSMGKLKQWMAVAYLEKKFGDSMHEVVFPYDDLYMQPRGDIIDCPARQRMSLRDFLKELREAPPGNLSRMFIEQGPIWSKEEEEHHLQMRRKKRRPREREDREMEEDRAMRMDMFREVDLPRFARFMRGSLDTVNFWMGSHGDEPKKSALHFDSSENLLVQLMGKKRFVVFPPIESHKVHPKRFKQLERKDRFPADPNSVEYQETDGPYQSKEGQEEEEEEEEEEEDDEDDDEEEPDGEGKRRRKKKRMVDNFSPVLVDAPDLERFPLYRPDEAIECIVKPGDVLYIPAFMWHNVYSTKNETEGVNAALNFWFRPSDMLRGYHEVFHKLLLDSNTGFV